MEWVVLAILVLIFLGTLGILAFTYMAWRGVKSLLDMNATGFAKLLESMKTLIDSQQVLSNQLSDVEEKTAIIDENVKKVGAIMSSMKRAITQSGVDQPWWKNW